MSHTDGTILLVYGKGREDGIFTPQAPTTYQASPRPLTNDPSDRAPPIEEIRWPGNGTI
jgi:hypothetical protein